MAFAEVISFCETVNGRSFLTGLRGLSAILRKYSQLVVFFARMTQTQIARINYSYKLRVTGPTIRRYQSILPYLGLYQRFSCPLVIAASAIKLGVVTPLALKIENVNYLGFKNMSDDLTSRLKFFKRRKRREQNSFTFVATTGSKQATS